jgi:hypothetical protein
MMDVIMDETTGAITHLNISVISKTGISYTTGILCYADG